jgi:Nucleotide modification associated domain 3
VKVGIINVGANASNSPLQSPIFEDGSFEFVPIPERAKIPAKCHWVPSYENLCSFYSKSSLNEYIPSKFLKVKMHNDPEFRGFTYGDYPNSSPRASNLRLLDQGDCLFFLARLVGWKNGYFTGPAGFYLVGFLEIDRIIKGVRSRNSFRHSDFGSNAHVIRGLCGEEFWDGFWVFKGSLRSQRFSRAIPFTREVASTVLRDRDEHTWRWNRRKTELQTIGSYTRSCRVITRPERIRKLWKWVSDSGQNALD